MKLIVVIVFGLYLIDVINGTIGPNQCNPSIHCASNSNECYPCNPRLNEDCSVGNFDNFGAGDCAERVSHNYTGITYGVPYYKRCRQIVDPGFTEVIPKPNPLNYVKGCRELEYTCNDGSCESVIDLLPDECNYGIIDSLDTDTTDCNIAHADKLQMIQNFWDNLDHSNYCQDSGIRYHPIRCSRPITGATLQEGNCPPGSPTLLEQCEKQWENGEILFGPSDACHAACDESRVPTELPGCCLIEDESVCSEIKIYSPVETIEKCDDDQLETEKCNVCLTTQENVAIDQENYPYCCLDDKRVNGTEPKCVNQNGIEQFTNEVTLCSNDDNDGLKDGADICYVDTSGSTAKPPPMSDTGGLIGGVEISFEFDPMPQVDEDTDCCCATICKCFGDPHCQSFLGAYEITQQSTGKFVLVKDGDFEIVNELGAPLGVNKKVHIKMGANEYVFNSFDIVFNRDFEHNGVKKSLDELPSEIEYIRTTDRPHANDTTPWGKQLELNQIMVDNPSYLIGSTPDGKYKFEIKAVRFRMTKGQHRGWWSRLDTSVRLKSMGSADGCCPTGQDILNGLPNTVDGFCFTSPFASESFLPGAFDITAPTSRRLGFTHDKDETDMSYVVSRIQKQLQTGIRHPLENKDEEKIVHQYAKIKKTTLVKAEVALHEQGIRSLQEELEIASDTCYSSATDEMFDPSSKTSCSQGLMLQAKLPASSSWIDVKFFPSNVNYCDDKISLIFDYTKVGSNTLTHEYELRLQHCSVNPSECDSYDECVPGSGVSNIGIVRYLYTGTITQAFKDQLELAKTNCECSETKGLCIQQCLKFGNCPVTCQ